MEGYKLVLDVSHHQTFNYDLVKKYVDGVIIRLGFGTQADSLVDKHYQGFKDIPCAGYQWFRPDQDVKMQIDLVRRVTEGKDIKVIFSDQEQRGHWVLGQDIAPYYSAAVLSEKARQHVEGLDLHGFEMGIYSRASWISAFAKPMYSWMFNYETWLASWPFAKGAITTSWESLISYWAPKKFSPYFTTDWPADKKNLSAWQWSGDKFIVPGIFTVNGAPRTSDFNFISDALFEKFTMGSVPPPPPPPPVVEPPAPTPTTLEERLTVAEDLIRSAYSELDQLQNIAREKGWPV